MGAKLGCMLKAGVRCNLIITTVWEQHPRPHCKGTAAVQTHRQSGRVQTATNSIRSFVLCQLGYNMWHKCSLHGTLLYNMLSSMLSYLRCII